MSIQLSIRLSAIAGLTRGAKRLADIGTDHGYLPIFLAQQESLEYAVAMDVNRGPLLRAQEHIRRQHLEAKITTRLSDGAQKLQPGEADCVVIAGMGGELMIRILDEGRHMWDSLRRLILSPQSELQKVRHFLSQEGFCILGENMVKDEGKYYTVMEVGRGSMEYGSEALYRYGACLIRDKNPVLKEYLQNEKARVEGILDRLNAAGKPATGGQETARRLLAEELQWIKEACDEMQ